MYDKFEGNENARIWEKALVENGKITWEDKFVMTEAEAREKNSKLKDSKQFVKSIETLKNNLNKNGKKVFEQEYLNQPLVDGDRLFDTEKIDGLIEYAKLHLSEKEEHWTIWEDFIPGNKYVM
ncbi:MAG: hypothetical protein ACTSO7_03690 [Candidatus Heimdallarchaeota archaeon]